MNREDNLETLKELTEYRIDWWLGLLIAIWYVINQGIFVAVEFFVYQQSRIPVYNRGVSCLIYMVITVSGTLVLFIVSKCSVSAIFEVILIIAMFFLTIYITSLKVSYIEYYIRDKLLREQCYSTIRIILISSQIIIPIVWCCMHIIKQQPLEWGKNYIVVPIVTLVILLLSMPAFDILKMLHVL